MAVQYRKANTPTQTKNSAEEEKSPWRKVWFFAVVLQLGITNGFAGNLGREAEQKLIQQLLEGVVLLNGETAQSSSSHLSSTSVQKKRSRGEEEM